MREEAGEWRRGAFRRAPPGEGGNYIFSEFCLIHAGCCFTPVPEEEAAAGVDNSTQTGLDAEGVAMRKSLSDSSEPVRATLSDRNIEFEEGQIAPFVYELTHLTFVDMPLS